MESHTGWGSDITAYEMDTQEDESSNKKEMTRNKQKPTKKTMPLVLTKEQVMESIRHDLPSLQDKQKERKE
jgi:hypothetical protein